MKELIHSPFKAATVLMLLAFLLYMPTIKYGYVWDDDLVITGNEITKKGFSSIAEIWTTKSYIEDRPTYRPVPQTMFAMEWGVAPNNPHFSRFINVLLYMLVVGVLYFLLLKFFPQVSPFLLFFISLLYVVHPAHVEVVANIKSRDELLSTGFAIGALFLVLRKGIVPTRLNNYTAWSLSFLLIIIAILSKISAITVTPILLVVLFIQHKEKIITFKKSLIIWVSFNKSNLLKAFFLVTFILVYRYFLSDQLSLVILLFVLIVLLNPSSNKYFDFITFLIFGSVLSIFESYSLLGLLSLYFFYKNIERREGIFPLIIIIILSLSMFSFGVAQNLIKWYLIPAVFFLQVWIYFSLTTENWKAKIFIALNAILSCLALWSVIIKGGVYLPACGIFIFLFFVNFNKHFFNSRFKNYEKAFFTTIFLGIFIINQYEGLVENWIQAQEFIMNEWEELERNRNDVYVLENQPYFNILVAAENTSEKLATIARVQWLYVQKLFYPHPLVHQHGAWQIKLASFKDWDVWLSIFVHLFLIGFVLKRIRKRCPIAIGILFYLVTISIYTNIFYLMPDTMAERFLFLPSVGFCIALVFGINRLAEKFSQQKSYVLTGIVLLPFFLFYTQKTWQRSKDWKDNYTLTANTIPFAKDNAVINAQYGAELKKKLYKNPEEFTNPAETVNLIEYHFKRAIDIYPDFYNANADLGLFYIEQAHPEKAFPFFKKAVELNDRKWINYYYLGLIYYDRTEYYKAMLQFREVLAKMDDEISQEERTNTYEYLGRALFTLNKVSEMKEILVENYTNFGEKSSMVLAGNLLAQKGRIQDALEIFYKLQSDYPNDDAIQPTIDFLKKF
jgi:tetratricopeptide (TPR) repeat protein